MLVWFAPSASHSIYARMFSGENNKLLLHFGSSAAQKHFQSLKTARFKNGFMGGLHTLHDSIAASLQIRRLHGSPIPPHHKTCDRDLVTAKAAGVQLTHCHVPEAGLRWCELCDVVHDPPGSVHQRMETLWSSTVGHGSATFECCSIGVGRMDPFLDVVYTKFWRSQVKSRLRSGTQCGLLLL